MRDLDEKTEIHEVLVDKIKSLKEEIENLKVLNEMIDVDLVRGIN